METTPPGVRRGNTKVLKLKADIFLARLLLSRISLFKILREKKIFQPTPGLVKTRFLCFIAFFGVYFYGLVKTGFY